MIEAIQPVGSDLAFDTASARLAAQSAEIDALDAKVGVALAADGVLVGFMFGTRTAVGSVWTIVAAGLALAVSGVAALLSFWPRRFIAVPEVRALAAMCISFPRASSAMLKWRWISTAVEAVEQNQRLLHHKVRWLKVSAIALLAGIVSLGINAATTTLRT
jgi:hypothetical protein